MSISKLINEILSEWAYRVDNGTPNPKNPLHIEVLSDVLSEMGMDNIKGELLESLTEADKQFTNPILNKEIPYKAKDGSTKKGIVGNLLRLPKDSEGRKAAEKMLPPDEKGREAAMKDLGSEKDGHSTTPQPKKEPTDKEGGEEGGQADAEAEKQKATQAMFQDPSYQSARLDAEKKAAEKLANSDPDKGEDGGTFGTDTKDEKENPKEETPGFKPVEPEEVTKEMPEADTSVFNQDSDIENISPQERHAISTKIDELSKLADEAKAKGEKAPNYNLCKVTVPGTNLYCDNNLGIPREDMPQFKGKPQPGSPADKMPKDKNGEVDTEEVFKKMLADKGIKTTDTEIPSDSLKASQSELVGAKVAGMAKALEADPLNKGITAPIYVSRDGYVIDGHHRWAAMTSKAIKDGKPANMKVHVIDMDAKDIIPMANKFAESIGVAAKKADANTETIPQHKEKSTKTDSLKNIKGESKTFKGATSGKEIKSIDFGDGAQVFGVEHRNKKMVDDIINTVKSTIPQEKWKDIVFLGEGGATDKNGKMKFNDEQIHAANEFNKMGASIDSWDGDDLDVHNDQSKLYKKQKEKTGLDDSQIKAGNWASMIGQGEGTDSMSPSDYLDEGGKNFLQSAAKEAGLPQIENWEEPTEQDKDTLYRLSFPEDNGDKETRVNDIQVAFNEARDENLLDKTKKLKAQGKIPITIAGEGHIDLVDNILKSKKSDSNNQTSTPSHKDNEQQNKVIASRIQDKIKGWAQEEKDFFTKKIYKGNSPERRSWGEAIKAKGIGAWHAIVKGAKHEVEEFKTAGHAVKSLVNGDKLDEHQKKALKAVGIKIATTALFGGLTGGLHHGASKFALHVAQELIPHTVSETIAKGIGKASLFAGAEEEDMYMEKFLNVISEKMADMDITPEMLEQMVDSYNEKNDSKTNEDISYMKDLVTETVIELINELMDEAEGFKAISNNTDRIVSFQTKQAMNAAIDSGSHRPVKATKPAPSKKEKPTGLAADKEYQAARGISPTQKTAPTGKLSSKMEDDDVFFPKKKVSEKQVEINTKIDSMPLNKESKTELKSIVTKILTGQDLNKHEKEFAGDWITIPATSEPKMYFATEAGNFANHNTQISFGTSMGEDSKQALYDFAETNEIFDKGHPVKKKSMVASQLTNNKGQKPRTKVKPVIKKSKDGIVESIKIGNTEMKRLPIPKYKDLLKQFTGKKPPMQNAEYEANLAIVALERHNAMLDDLATSGAGEIEIIDFGHDTSTSEGRKATIDTIKDMMYNKLYQDFKKYYKGEIPKEAKTVLYALKNLPNPYDNPKGNASETFQQNLDTIASMMNNNADFRAGVPDMQEIFDFMVKLGEGYAGFMPSASNWKVTDIVTYKATPDFKIKPGQSPAEVISQNIQQIKSTVLLEGGASVKYEKGGASAGYDKIMMTVYNEHKGFDTKKELLKLFEFYKWAFTPAKNEGNRYRSAAEVTAKEKELNDTLNRAVSVGILDESQKKKILAEGESQAKRMEAKVEKKVPFAKFKQCFGKTDKEQVSNYQTYKKQLGLWCKMGAVAEGINNNDMKYQLFSNLRTKYSKAKAGKVKPPVHEVIDGVSTLNGMGWSYDPGISATGKECKFISMNNANSSHINPIRRK